MVTYCKSRAQAEAEMAEWLFTAVGASLPNNYGNQCSAAMQSYAATLFGRPYTETLNYGNAIDHIDNASTVYFDKIWNDPTNPNQLPRAGDIAVYKGAAPLWDGRYYGHTGAVLSFTASTQTIVQQDGAAEPTRLFPDGYRYSVKPVHTDTFAYLRDPRVGDVRGWLRPKWQKVVYTGADTRGYGTSTTAKPQPIPTAPKSSTMNGIDVSNWQKGINLAVVPADFVGVLATDGATFKSPTLDEQITAAQRKTPRTMVYHFARVGESDAATQARHFLSAASKHIAAGALPVLDWEQDEFNHRADWAIAWINHVEKATGKQVIVYQRVAAAAHKSWGTFRRPMWLSWYGTNSERNGYATSFTGMPAVPGWNVVLWQYGDRGKLPGYSGHLDLNVAFGDPWGREPGLGAMSNTITSLDPLERIMSWYPNKAAYEKAVFAAVVDTKFRDLTGKWVHLGQIMENWRADREFLYALPALVLGYDVDRVRTGAGEKVNLATLLAWDKENRARDAAERAKVQEQNRLILAQQAQILEKLGATTENGE